MSKGAATQWEEHSHCSHCRLLLNQCTPLPLPLFPNFKALSLKQTTLNHLPTCKSKQMPLRIKASLQDFEEHVFGTYIYNVSDFYRMIKAINVRAIPPNLLRASTRPAIMIKHHDRSGRCLGLGKHKEAAKNQQRLDWVTWLPSAISVITLAVSFFGFAATLGVLQGEMLPSLQSLSYQQQSLESLYDHIESTLDSPIKNPA